MIKQFISKNIELLFWLAALIALAIADPAGPSHFILCPLKLMGITWCPGCGLGHSIAYLLHGDIKNSFHAHWIGVPALGIILYRISVLAAPPKSSPEGRTFIFGKNKARSPQPGEI